MLLDNNMLTLQLNTRIYLLLFYFFLTFSWFTYSHRVVVTKQWFNAYFLESYFPWVTGLW